MKLQLNAPAALIRPKLAAVMKVRPGTVLGPYRIDAELGRGGMATVFKAFQPSLARIVAVKVLPDFFADDADFKERFQQEAIAVAGLRHPNIPVVHDYGESDGTTYIVSEYVGGGTLTDRLGQPLPVEHTIEMLRPVASALDYAHSKGVLHRDVKPSNILIDADGRPMLADFGLAKILGAESSRLTKTGTIVGTPEYMSPEQCEGESLTPASDIYALGVVAYEMLTGRPPFTGPTPVAVLVAQVKDPLPSPRSLNLDLTEGVERVVVKALAKDPTERYATCGEFITALSTAATAGESRSTPRHLDSDAPVGEIAGSHVPESDGGRSESGAGGSLVDDDLALHSDDPAATQLPGVVAHVADKAVDVEAVASPPPDREMGPKASRDADVGLSDSLPRWRRALRASRTRLLLASAIVIVVATGGTIGYIQFSGLSHTSLVAGARSSPSPSPAATPSTSPSSSLTPSPSPSLSPSPTPLGPSIHISLVPGGTSGWEWTMSGSHFTPGSTVTIRLYVPPNSPTYQQGWTAPVAANGTFQARGSAAVRSGQTGRFLVCDTKNLCASTEIAGR
ncbi:MAG TPA: serine/threonine-protein kinase [Candidatus Dormibacteraeota bacterium]|nr:serine/threonine-protein kinase [Candidatus Dormibacteraeota bacterium]